MKDFDFGYFGTGDEGYAQYMTAFERTFSADSESDDLPLDDDFAEDNSDEDL